MKNETRENAMLDVHICKVLLDEKCSKCTSQSGSLPASHIRLSAIATTVRQLSHFLQRPRASFLLNLAAVAATLYLAIILRTLTGKENEEKEEEEEGELGSLEKGVNKL